LRCLDKGFFEQSYAATTSGAFNPKALKRCMQKKTVRRRDLWALRFKITLLSLEKLLVVKFLIPVYKYSLADLVV
jgi:hypothetical protein